MRHWCLLLLLFAVTAQSKICVVDTGGGGDYTDFATALAGCRGTYPDVNVTLLCTGTSGLTLAGLALPTHLSDVQIQSQSGSPSDCVINDIGFVIDTSEPGSQPNVLIQNVTFELDGSANGFSNVAFGNQNFSLVSCIVRNSTAPVLISMEPCKNEQVMLTLVSNLFQNISNMLFDAVGMNGWTITNNLCQFCGTNISENAAVAHLRQSDALTFPRIYNFNDMYRQFNCRAKPRCLYSMYNDGDFVRCQEGQVQCYDQVATAARGNCPITTTLVTDFTTNNTALITDFDSSCRVFGPCVCSSITYANSSAGGQTLTLQNGNLVYAAGTPVQVTLPCRPRVTQPFGKELWLFQYTFYGGKKYVFKSDDANLKNNGFGDKASSALLGLGYQVTLYKDKNFSNTNFTIINFSSDFGDAFDNVASSLRFSNVSWTNTDVPRFNGSFTALTPQPELNQDLGYYSAIWKQPVNMVSIKSVNVLLQAPYTLTETMLDVRPFLTFENGSSFFMFFDAGVIYPTQCAIVDCQNQPGGDDLKCDYALVVFDNATFGAPLDETYFENTEGFQSNDSKQYTFPYPVTPFTTTEFEGAHCLNGDTYCCTSPAEGTANFPAYAVDCSSSPNATIPILYPNGTVVTPLDGQDLPEDVFHCNYLVNCTYDPTALELDDCKEFSCGMTPCRLGVQYQPGDDCYALLQMNDTDLICNETNTANTGRLCQFLQADCLDYYYNGYLKSGYAFAADSATHPTDTVVPTLCEFHVEDCVRPIAAPNQGVFFDSVCYCSTCNISWTAEDCSLNNSPPAPLPMDAICVSAVLDGTGSTTSLSDCLAQVNVDSGCTAALTACNLTAVPPYDGIVNGETCYTAVQTALNSNESVAYCMTGGPTNDTACLDARIACAVTRQVRPLNLPCLEDFMAVNSASVLTTLPPTTAPTSPSPTTTAPPPPPPQDTGNQSNRRRRTINEPTTPPPGGFGSTTAFPPPATYPVNTATSETVDPCFDPAQPSPNATCTAARAFCNVYNPQPYQFPDASCFMTAMTIHGAIIPLYQCADLSFSTMDAGCLAARDDCAEHSCYTLLGLGASNADQDCSNPYASDATVDTFCLWVRYDCKQYYDGTTARLLAGFCFGSDPTCTGTIIPEQCDLDVNSCAPSADTRCHCEADTGNFPTETNVPILTVEAVVYGRTDLGAAYYTTGQDQNGNSVALPAFEPSSDPIRLPRPLRFDGTDALCPAQFWAGCQCPPETFQLSQTPLPGCEINELTGYCNDTTLSDEYNALNWTSADGSLNGTIYMQWPTHDYQLPMLGQTQFGGMHGLYCSTVTKRIKCDCSFSFLVAQGNDSAPFGSAGLVLDNVNFNDTDFQFLDNAICDYYYGLVELQDDATEIRDTSFVEPDYADSFSALRDLYRNPNDYILGQVPFIAEPRSFDPRPCVDGCPQTPFTYISATPSEVDANYVIDNSISPNSPAYGITVFRSFYHYATGVNAPNAKVYVRNSGKAYFEPQQFPCPNNGGQQSSATACGSGNIDEDGQNLVLQFGKTHANTTFFSTEAPVVVVNNFGIVTPDAVRMVFQGIHFRHPGDSRDAIIKMVRGSKQINPGFTELLFLNCDFEGGGVSSNGILSTLGTINMLVFSHCSMENWNIKSLYADRVRRFVFVGNTINNCIGNCIHARVVYTYAVRDNTYIECRGGGKISGAACLTLTGINDLSTNNNVVVWQIIFGSVNTRPPPTCFPGASAPAAAYYPGALPNDATSRYTTWNMTCHLWHNEFISDTTGPDYDDSCIEVWDGHWTPNLLRGTGCRKARYGVSLYGSDFEPTPENLDILARNNPRTRPTLYRSSDATEGSDYHGITPEDSIVFVFGFGTQSRLDWAANWPANGDVANEFLNGSISCVVNNNYSPRTMEEAPYFNVLRLERMWAYGYAEFRNGSDAAVFCNDFRKYGFPPVVAPMVFVTTERGSEFIRDNITLVRDLRFLGDPTPAFPDGAFVPDVPVTPAGTNVTVLMDQGVPGATPCTVANGVKPCIQSDGNTIATLLTRWDDMCWQPISSQMGLNLWSNGDPAPVSVEIYRNEFDGRNLLPLTNTYALLIGCGTIIPQNSDSDPQLTDELPDPTACTIIMHDSVVANYTSYAASVVSITPHGTRRRVLLTDYPVNSGAVFVALNPLNADTFIDVSNNTFLNIDDTPLTISNFINATIEYNLFINCSGRSIQNFAVLIMQGNPSYSTEPDESNTFPPGKPYWSISYNTAYQEKTILTPYAANQGYPKLLSGFYLGDVSENTTMCIFGNIIQTYPVGWTFTDFNLTVLLSCPGPGDNPRPFPDAKRFLRFIANHTNCTRPDMNGTIYDLEITFQGTQTEATHDSVVCNFCCPPGPPTACWVDISTILFNPTHPWWDFAVFNSLNRAIERCNSTTRTIFIIGSSDPFLAFDGLAPPFKVYTEQITATIPPNTVNQTGQTLRIVGDRGMIWYVNGNHLDNPNNVTTVLSGIEFVSVTGSSVPIWNFLSNATIVTNLITLERNLFVGNNTGLARSIDGVFDGKFTYNRNTHINFTQTSSVSRFEAEDCDALLLFTSNSYFNLPGQAAEVTGFASGSFNNDSCLRCGGDPSVADTDRWVFFLNPGCPGTVGSQHFDRNRVTAGAVVDTDPTRAAWTALYIDPVQWGLPSQFLDINPAVDTKFFTFYDNRASGLMIGMRLNNVNQRCGPGDPQNFLRLMIFSKFRNQRVHGQLQEIGDLYIGAFDATEEQTREAVAEEARQFHFTNPNACFMCKEGCPAFRFAIGTVILLLLFVGIAACVALSCFFCPTLLGCCIWRRPPGLVYDPATGLYVPNTRDGQIMLTQMRTPNNLRTGVPTPPVAQTGGVNPYEQHLTAGAFTNPNTGANLVYRGNWHVPGGMP